MKRMAAGSDATNPSLPPTFHPPLTGRQRTSSIVPRAGILYLVGGCGGLLGGLLGIGGGSAIAPLLLLTGSLRPAQVAGTTLATVVLISLVGSGAYASLGHLNLELAWPIAMGSVTGSVLGALASKRLSMRLMLALFLVILPYFAAKELWPSFASPELTTGLVSLVALGFGTGFLSGLLGISGASIVVPSLVGFFLFDHHAAQGIAISVALADSLAGSVTHGLGRNINYRALLYMAVPAVLAALGGAFLSDSLSNSVLRYVFVIFMAATWAMLLQRLIVVHVGHRLRPPGNLLAPHSVPGPHRPALGVSRTWTGLAIGGLKLRKRFNGGLVMNAMLVFVVLAIASDRYGLSPVLIFAFSALACVGLSYRLGQATESLGSRLGPVAGGLLNATFGNAAELIISIMALHHGLFVVVRTGLIGSILGQLLLVLGTSLLLAGLKYRNLDFSRPLVQINFTLMALALVAIGLPTIMLAAAADGGQGPRLLTPILSALLLAIYVFAVFFSLRRQPEEQEDAEGPRWSLRTALVVLAVSTGGIVFVSELLVGSIIPFAESTGISEVFIGLILIPIFGNVVDHIVAITVAMKNRMDLSLTISVGSAAQVACLVMPVIVLIGVAMGHSAGLVFTPIELIAMAAGLFLMVPVLLDGESNWLEGAELLTCYLILGVVMWSF